LNPNSKNIKDVLLSLTFPPLEEEQQDPVGGNVIRDTSILIDVLEPELEDEERDKILKALGLSEGYLIANVSVKIDKVTYMILDEDTRFTLSATFE